MLKLHPVDQSNLDVDLSNISVVERSAEIYDIMPHIDALISDYSSIIWDYMLLDRPIIYFLPDHEQFINSGRALNFGIHEHAVGPICNNETELAAAISNTGAMGNLTSGNYNSADEFRTAPARTERRLLPHHFT